MRMVLGTFVALLFTLFFAGVSLNAGNGPDGKALYESNKCSMCHAQDGKGNKKMKTVEESKLDLTDDETTKKSDAELSEVIKEGSSASKMKMKAYDKLSAEEVTALVKYVRSLKK